jgi:histidinol-phosphate aminotransferase
VLKKNIRSVVAQRGKLFSELSKIEGVKPYPSEANFILFRVTDPDIIYEGLLNRGVLVRNMRGVVDGCLRVTVGRPEENRIFIDALKNVIRDGERKK